MSVREKRIDGYTYLYLVETVREDGRAKQRIIKNLGRKEAVVASGGLERLAASVARYAERAMVLSQLAAGDTEGVQCRRIGAPLLFGRLWQETGCQAALGAVLAGRGFEFEVERAVFATVLHRIMAAGSDRASWPGSARNGRPASRPAPRPSPRAASRPRSRRSSSPAGATCSARSPSRSSTPPRCASRARAARRSAGAAIPRTTGPTSTR